MKIFKLKHFVILMALGLLWSCQLESVTANSPEAVAARKKHYEKDGIPSDSDDEYEFSKSQYYHNDKLLTDTIQIANLLSNARLLHIDGTRKDICATDQEVKVLNAKLNIQNNDQSRATTALDGDNYIHYFYEIARYDTTSKPLDYCEFIYFSIVGPHVHSSATPVNYTFQYYTRTGIPGSPRFVRNYNTANMPFGGNFRNLYQLCSNSRISSAFIANSNVDDFTTYYTINVVNTTRFKRNVEIVADNGTVVRFSLAPKKSKSVHGSHLYTNLRKFNGIQNFIVKWIRSNKA